MMNIYGIVPEYHLKVLYKYIRSNPQLVEQMKMKNNENIDDISVEELKENISLIRS